MRKVLRACPVCQRANVVLEELAPEYEGGGTGWRVICYGCLIMTARTTSREKATEIYERFTQNLDRRRSS